MSESAFHIKDIQEAIVGFAQFLRSKGFDASVAETKYALQIGSLGIYQDDEKWHQALRSLYCTSIDEFRDFDQLFDAYWRPDRISYDERKKNKVTSVWTKKTNTSLVYLGQGEALTDGDEESSSVSGANALERIKKTDFTQLNAEESEELDRLARQLFEQMSKRLKRKWKESTLKGKLNMRRTIRNSMSSGGTPVQLRFKRKDTRKPRLCLLLDISGSMDKYSFYLLKFMFALQFHFEYIESFVFSTSLTRITDLLKKQSLETVLKGLSHDIGTWSGGTQIGKSLRSFNENFANRILSGKSIVIILSDGLETGDVHNLKRQVIRLKSKANRLIWLNPLKGMENYSPESKGMKEVLDELDVFSSAHNLDSLLELENQLTLV